MQDIIDKLIKQVEDLTERVNELEKINKASSKSVFVDTIQEKEPIKSEIMIKSLKEPRFDRFGKVAGVNEEVREALYENKIDRHENRIMLSLAIEKDHEYVSIEYLMSTMDLSFEQVMEMVDKLEKLSYIEIVRDM